MNEEEVLAPSIKTEELSTQEVILESVRELVKQTTTLAGELKGLREEFTTFRKAGRF